MDKLLSNVSFILIIVAAICTITSIIVQLTKEIGFLNKIPTAIQTTVTSIVLTVVGFIGYASYKNYIIKWYYIFAVVIVGVVIGYITMFGWDSFIGKFKSYNKNEKDFKK